MSVSPESFPSASDSGGRSSEAKDKLARMTLTDEQRQTAQPDGNRYRIAFITAAGLVCVLVVVVAFNWLLSGDDPVPEAGGSTAAMSAALPLEWAFRAKSALVSRLARPLWRSKSSVTGEGLLT